MLDEVEALNGKNKSETTLILLSVLNAGHRKGATIPRCVGAAQQVHDFPVYGPKLFCAIGRLPDTLMDRSIVIHMKRRTKAQQVARFQAAAELDEAIGERGFTVVDVRDDGEVADQLHQVGDRGMGGVSGGGGL